MSKLTNRRDLLKMGVVVSAVATTYAAPTELVTGSFANHAEEAKAEATDGKSALGAARIDPMDAELCELVLFHKRLSRVRAAALAQREAALNGAPVDTWAAAAKAISIPRGTTPCSVYLRLTREQLSIPVPKIPNIHTAILNGDNSYNQWYLSQVCRRLAKQLHLIPNGTELVNEITLRYGLLKKKGDSRVGKPVARDRVVSPRYTVDIEEPVFGQRLSAAMLLDSVTGIWEEWNRKIDWAATAIKPPVREIHNQVTPVQVSIVREAFMLEFMAWNTGGGWVA